MEWLSSWQSSLVAGDAAPCVHFALCPGSSAYLSSNDTRLPAPSPTTALLPGDARRAFAGASADFFSPPLPAAERELAAALARVGGAALVKACGAAPLDAAWASANGDATAPMRCASVSDVWALLKASDRVRDATRAATARGVTPWVEVHAWLPRVDPRRELRAFLRGDGALAAVAARHDSAALAFPTEDAQRAAAAAVSAFLSDRTALCALVSAHGGAAIDVLLHAKRVRVVDVSARDRHAEKAGYTWDEIDALGAAAPCAVRFRSEDGRSAGGVHFPPFSAHAFPDDVFDFAALRVGAGGALCGEDPALLRAAGRAGAKGWEGLIESLAADGLFFSGAANRNSDESEG
jgi:hypothetical protein